MRKQCTYLLSVDGTVIRAQKQILYTVDADTVGLQDSGISEALLNSLEFGGSDLHKPQRTTESGKYHKEKPG